MTELRDARLQKALDAAPDADARPPPGIAGSIRAAARSTLTPARPLVASAPWWQRLWAGTGKPGAPWGAAFATVLLGVLVTALWIDKPVPDAQPMASAPLPAASPAATPAPAPAPVAAPDVPKANQEAKATREEPAKLADRAPAKVPPQTQTQPPVAVAAATPAAPPAASVAAPAPSAASAQAIALVEKANSMGAARAPSVNFLAADAGAPSAKRSRAESTVDAPESVDITLQGLKGKAGAAASRKLYAMALGLEPQMTAVASSTAMEAGPTLALEFRAQGEVIATFTLREPFATWHRPGRAKISTTLTEAQVAQFMQAAQAAKAELEAQPAADPAR